MSRSPGHSTSRRRGSPGVRSRSPLAVRARFAPDACPVSLRGVILCSHTTLTVLQSTSKASPSSSSRSPRATQRPDVDRDSAAVGYPHHRFLGVCSVPLLQFYRHGQRVSITRGETYLLDNAACTSDIQSLGGSSHDSNPCNWENLVLQCDTPGDADLLVEALLQGHAEEIFDPPTMPDNVTDVLRSSRSRSRSAAGAVKDESCTPYSRDTRQIPTNTTEGGEELHEVYPPPHRAYEPIDSQASATTRSDSTRRRRSRSSKKTPTGVPPSEVERMWRRFMVFEHHRQHLLLYMHKELVHQAYNAAEAAVAARTAMESTRHQRNASFSERERARLDEIEQKLDETDALYKEVKRQKAELSRQRRELEEATQKFEEQQKQQASRSQRTGSTKPIAISRTETDLARRKHSPQPAQAAVAPDGSYLGHLPNNQNMGERRVRRVLHGREWMGAFFPLCEEELRHCAVIDVATAAKQPRALITLERLEPVDADGHSLLAVATTPRGRRHHPKSMSSPRHASKGMKRNDANAPEEETGAGLLVEAVVRFNVDVTDADTMERRLHRCDFALLHSMYAHRDGFKALQEQKRTSKKRQAYAARRESSEDASSSPGGVSTSTSEVNSPEKDGGRALEYRGQQHDRRHRPGEDPADAQRYTSPYGKSHGYASTTYPQQQQQQQRPNDLAYPPSSRSAHPQGYSGYAGAPPSPHPHQPYGWPSYQQQQQQAQQAQPRGAGGALVPFAASPRSAAADEGVDRAMIEVAEARQRRLMMAAHRHRVALLLLQDREKAERRRLQQEEEPVERLALTARAAPMRTLYDAMKATTKAEEAHREQLLQVERRARERLQRDGASVLQRGAKQAKAALLRDEEAERLLIESEALSHVLDLVGHDRRRKAEAAEARKRSERYQHGASTARAASVLNMADHLQEAERDDRDGIMKAEARTRAALRQEIEDSEDIIREAQYQRDRVEKDRQRRAEENERERARSEAEAMERERLRQLEEQQQETDSAAPNEPTVTLMSQQQQHRTDATSRESTYTEGDSSYNRRRRLDSQRRVKPFHYMTFSPEDMDFMPNAESAIEGILGCTINRNLEVVEISRRLPKAEEEELEFQAGDMILDASGQSLHSISHLREVLSHRIMLIQEEVRQEFPDVPEEEVTTNPALQKYIEVLCEHHNFLMQVLRGCDIIQIIVKS
eukprot:gene12242-8428_t